MALKGFVDVDVDVDVDKEFHIFHVDSGSCFQIMLILYLYFCYRIWVLLIVLYWFVALLKIEGEMAKKLKKVYMMI